MGCRALRLQHLQPMNPVVEAHRLQYMGLVALQHVESSHTRDRTLIPCTDRWILHQWTTEDVQKILN